jgi:phenylacetate-CoA ligase
MTDVLQKLQGQLAYAYEKAPAVKDLFDKASITPNDIQELKDITRLAVTSKDDFTEMQQTNPPFGGWLAIPPEDLQRIYISPGPIYDAHGSDKSGMAGFAETFEKAGFIKGDRVINTFLYHLVPAGLLADEALLSSGIVVVPTGPGNTEVQIKVMMDLQVNGYMGTPSFLGIILDKIEEMGIPKEAIPLKKAFFSAEPYFPFQRQRYEGEYGLMTSQAYATADLGIIAYEVPDEKGWIIPESVFVELVDPETGEWVEEGTPGEVVVTTFNKDYPLVRFGTGDMAIMIPGTGRLAGLVGRSGEAIKVRGMFMHPNQLKLVMGQVPGINNMQAVVTHQEGRDHVNLHVVKEAEAQIDAATLQNTLKEAARLTVNEVTFVDEVEGSRLILDKRSYR